MVSPRHTPRNTQVFLEEISRTQEPENETLEFKTGNEGRLGVREGGRSACERQRQEI
jgi:hypothetical protein